MHWKNSPTEKVISDFKAARKRFELYEKFYISLNRSAKEYLKKESKKYKGCLKEIQALILPSISRICPTCNIQCCKLYISEHSIYIATTVGGFDLKDYLLARCDEFLPDPCYENAEKNVCPFWNFGCILAVDCRSYLCIQYFCDELLKEIDMKPVSECLRKIRAVLDGFSIGRCMV